jgi:hypothetical protein
MFENRVLKRTFGPKRQEVTGGWRILHNEELHNLYTSPNIIRVNKSRRMILVGHVACVREVRNVYSILVRKPERKRLLPRQRCIWEDNIRMDFRQVE